MLPDPDQEPTPATEPPVPPGTFVEGAPPPDPGYTNALAVRVQPPKPGPGPI